MSSPGSLFAYPSDTADYPEGLARSECIDCHASAEEELLSPGEGALVRKGPHGGYSASSARCQVCHSVHTAFSGDKLLPADSVKAVCESCHDGTGGGAVYGVIQARTGEPPAAVHRIDTTDVIPGGDGNGGDLAREFSGAGGFLTCSDCHSVHDVATVEPFVGDRLRASVASDTAGDVGTNRLLKRSPTGSAIEVDVYGAGWCTTCHEGRAGQHAEDSGIIRTHPVAEDDEYHYDNLPVVDGFDSHTTELGQLGRSNRGYVMPATSVPPSAGRTRSSARTSISASPPTARTRSRTTIRVSRSFLMRVTIRTSSCAHRSPKSQRASV